MSIAVSASKQNNGKAEPGQSLGHRKPPPRVSRRRLPQRPCALENHPRWKSVHRPTRHVGKGRQAVVAHVGEDAGIAGPASLVQLKRAVMASLLQLKLHRVGFLHNRRAFGRRERGCSLATPQDEAPPRRIRRAPSIRPRSKIAMFRDGPGNNALMTTQRRLIWLPRRFLRSVNNSLPHAAGDVRRLPRRRVPFSVRFPCSSAGSNPGASR